MVFNLSTPRHYLCDFNVTFEFKKVDELCGVSSLNLFTKLFCTTLNLSLSREREGKNILCSSRFRLSEKIYTSVIFIRRTFSLVDGCYSSVFLVKGSFFIYMYLYLTDAYFLCEICIPHSFLHFSLMQGA